MNRIKRLAAGLAVVLAVAGGGLITAQSASAATVSPAGLNTCTVTYVREKIPGCINLSPGSITNPCYRTVKRVVCTQY